MPWKTLELDPASATARDVKRAYAKRLKTCRPDHDPEGFRELHDAYTAALGELQWRENGGNTIPFPEQQRPPEQGHDDIESSSDAVVAVSHLPVLSPGVEAIVDILDRLEGALKNDQPGVAGLVREAEAVLYQHPVEVVRWGELVHDLIARHGKHEDLRLKPEAILFELENNGAAATIAVIDRQDRNGSPQAIANLATLLLSNSSRVATPAGGFAAARLAGAAAFWAKRHVEALANFAYQNLARGERDFHMEMIDRHVGMAGLLAMVPDDLKSFWRQRLINTPGRDAWEDEESLAALRWLRTPAARRGPCYQVLKGILPEDIARTLQTALPPAPDATDSTTSTTGGSSTHSWEQPATSQRGRRGTTAKPAATRDDWRELEDLPARGSNRPGSRDSSGGERRTRRTESAPVRRSSTPFWKIALPLLLIVKLVLIAGRCSSRESASSAHPPATKVPLPPVLDREEFLRQMRQKPKTGDAAAPSWQAPPSTLTLPSETPRNPYLDHFKNELPVEK